MNTYTRIELEPAYVLHSRAYRDTSLLIEIFTKTHGKIGLVARGVKKSKSNLNALLQPFRPLLISWGAKGDLGTLRAVEQNGKAHMLTGRSMASGFYVNELLMRLLHRHDAHAVLFYAYEEVLTKLSGNDVLHEAGSDESHEKINIGMSEQRALRIFEKHLLRELGYGLVLDHDVVTTQTIDANELYRYELEKGPVLAENNDKDDLHINVSGKPVMMHGHSLLSLQYDVLNDAVSLRETKHLMRAVLNTHLGGRPLNSKQLLGV